jgi:hypothetical protein
MNVIQGQKPCARYKPLFDSYISNELLVETTHEILRHIEECRECSFELEQRSKTRDLLRRSMSGVHATDEFRSRVQSALREPQSIQSSVQPRRNARFLQIAAALAITVMSGVLFQFLVRDPARLAAILDLGWNQHVMCTLAGHYPQQPPPRERMLKDLGAAYVSLLPAVESQLPEYTIRKAHICRSAGRQFAHLILQKDAVVVSVSILRKNDGEGLSSSVLKAANRDLRMAVRDRGEIVAFETASHVAYIMGNQTSLEMQVVAQRIGPAVRALQQ